MSTEELKRSKKKRDVASIVFTVVATMILAFMIIMVDIVLPKLEVHVVERVTMEAGGEYPELSVFFDKEGKNIAFAKPLEEFVDKNQPGEYEVTLLISDKEYTSILEVVDTTAPEVVTKSAEIQAWETVSVEELIVSVLDSTETTVVFAETPDFTEVGVHEVPIIATDAYDNSVTVNATVEVLADTEAPVITGVENITATVGNTISYRKNISVSDNSGGDVTLEIDNSKVDTSKAGTYTVYYKATDASGNVATAEAIVTMKAAVTPTEASLTPYLDSVIAKVTNSSMSQYDKAYALWKWCRANITYSHSSGNRETIWHGVYEGIYKRYGDCYAYYATYSALLTRCGIENLCVARINGTTNHWWNLVNVGNGWYHCDASPRTAGDPYLCFMQTDAQVAEYTANHEQKPNYYTFDPSAYPERATEIIFGD